MIPALAVVNLARIEVARKWDYRHFGAQCLLVARPVSHLCRPAGPVLRVKQPRPRRRRNGAIDPQRPSPVRRTRLTTHGGRLICRTTFAQPWAGRRGADG